MVACGLRGARSRRTEWGRKAAGNEGLVGQGEDEQEMDGSWTPTTAETDVAGLLLADVYALPASRQGWSDLDWTPRRQRSPSMEDGVYVAALGKVMVWVLTQANYRNGADPDVCGFHLETRKFDDDCEGGGDEVMLWAPLCIPQAEERKVA